ncbi:MAG TPA: FAD-dependent monooxygenase [Pseudonocardiaceae bacterium]|nr:FAD-dependent monooxygenase [Pseudonocardiaceae bacterium]
MADPAEGSHAVDRITLRHLLLSDLEDTVHFGKTFTHLAPRPARLLAESDPDSVMLMQHKASVPVPAWPSTNVTLLGDALHSMPPVGGLGGNAALRDANLLCATLTAVRNEQCALVPALHRYEAELRTCGYGAARTALRTQRQGLRSNHLAVAETRAWFRACNAVPALKPLNLPYRSQAQPRTWERAASVQR